MHLSPKFDQALHYAVLVHAGQIRKGANIPYISHLLGVVSIALEYGANEAEAIGALLHDAGEDAGGEGRIADIRHRFGDAVADIVQGCTDAVTNPKPPWQKRKKDYIAHIPKASASVRLVSASDKLHNTRAILRDFRKVGDEVWTRFKGGKDGTLWYYRSLITAFRQAGNSDLIDELDRVVTDLEQIATKPSPEATYFFTRLQSATELARGHRRWNGNDATHRHHHAPVSLADDPLDLALNWKTSAGAEPKFVGNFRLQLKDLLAAGYIRQDTQPGHVRLRIFHDHDGSFYIETRPGSPRLLLSKVG